MARRDLPPEIRPLAKKSYLFLLIATFCWGGNAIAGKLAAGHISPMALTFCRWAFAMAVLVLVSGPQLRKDWPVVRRHLPLFLAYGAIGYTAFSALMYTALHHTTALNVAIVQAGIPMLIFAINFVLFSTRVTLAQIIGFSLTLFGVAVVASHGDMMSLLTLGVNYGDLLMLVAVACYAVYTVILRYKPPISWKSLMAMPALAALVTSLPLVWWEYRNGALLWPDAQGWWITLYAGLVSSLLAQVAFIIGVEGIGPNRAGLFINLVPVFGTLLSIAILGETLHAYHIAALALSLGGIAIAERGKAQAT